MSSKLLVILVVWVAVASASRLELAAQQAAQPQAEEGFAVADDGTRLYWRSIGEGEQVVIVPLSAWMFEEFRTLARGRRLVFYDMRNRGGSDGVEDSRYGLDYEVRDLEAVRRTLDLPKVSLIGHSYMGAIVTLYARDFPDRVERVVLTGPAGPLGTTFREAERPAPNDNVAAQQQFERMRAEGLERSNPVAYCRAFIRLVVLPPMVRDSAALPRFRADPCMYDREWPGRWNRYVWRVVDTFGDWDWTQSLSQLNIPFLIIHGTEDSAAPLQGSVEWINLMPQARLLRIERAGHLPWLEAPNKVFQAIDEFLRGEWPSDAESARRP